jgi:hypothetical protein
MGDDNGAIWRDLAREAMDRGDWMVAEGALRRLLELEAPEPTTASLRMLDRFLECQQRRGEAAACFTKALERGNEPRAVQGPEEPPSTALALAPGFRRHWVSDPRGIGVIGDRPPQRAALHLWVSVPVEVVAAGAPLLRLTPTPGCRLVGGCRMRGGQALPLVQLREAQGSILLAPPAERGELWHLVLVPPPPNPDGETKQLAGWLTVAVEESPGGADASLFNGGERLPLPAEATRHLPGDPFPVQAELAIDEQLRALRADPSLSPAALTRTLSARLGPSTPIERVRLGLLLSEAVLRAMGRPSTAQEAAPEPQRWHGGFRLYWDRPETLGASLRTCQQRLQAAFPGTRLLQDGDLDTQPLDFQGQTLVERHFRQAPHPALRSDLLRLALPYNDHAYIDLDNRFDERFPTLIRPLIEACLAQSVNLILFLKRSHHFWGSLASCWDAYPNNDLLVLTRPLRRRWLSRLEAELGPVPFRGDIHHATGPGFLGRVLFEDPGGDWHLSGALGTALGELPLWEDDQGERFLFLTKDALGLDGLDPAEKYLHHSQNWRTFPDR